MRHPTEGVLRQLLDEPAGVADATREHVAGCPRCLGELAAVRADAVLVGAALATEAGADVDVDVAWQRLSTAATAQSPARTTSSTSGAWNSGSSTSASSTSASSTSAVRSRFSLRRPAVAAVAAAVFIGGGAAAAANDWLQIFETEQIAPVTFSAADLNALPDLSAYGDVSISGDGDLRQVPDAATAEAQTGLDAPEVTTLPRGVSGDPVYQVGDEVSATFTFSADRAARAAADVGETLPPPPPGLDGSQVRLVAGPGVAGVWTQQQAGVPNLVVGRAVAPTAFSSGVPFETARTYVLSLPGLPDDVAAQLRTFNADGSVLPLPVNSDELTASPAEVNGRPATVLATNDRTLAAVVWVEDGVVTAVAGSLDADEVLAVARGLR